MTFPAALLVALAPLAALKPTPVPAPAPAPASEQVEAKKEPEPTPQERVRQELFEQKCTKCHTADRAIHVDLDRTRWEDFLRKHRKTGLGITDAQVAEIAALLQVKVTEKP
jgi:cytochrome c5